MSADELGDLIERNQLLRFELRCNVARTTRLAKAITDGAPERRRKDVLLQVLKGLNLAYEAAKADDDGYTCDLIQDALEHVGRRFAKER